MWQSEFEYHAALSEPGGGAIADVRLDVDWVPAVRWAEFERDVEQASAAAAGLGEACARARIEPRWSASKGRPYVGGFSIRADAAEPVDFPLSYFSGAVKAAATRLVTSGALVAGQRFDYEVYALAGTKPTDVRTARPSVVAVDPAPSVETLELAPLLARAEVRRPHEGAVDGTRGNGAARTMPILLPQRLLEETTELAERAGGLETGGILVGSLCRDPGGALFARVSAQIPATHTQATRDSLRFTPQTWVDVEAAIELRGRGEIPLGWWHNHPFFCVACTPAQRAVCPFSVPTFSRDDRHVHREVFQKPWSIALLLSFLGAQRPSYDVFGWNRGQIEAFEFFTLTDEVECTGGAA